MNSLPESEEIQMFASNVPSRIEVKWELPGGRHVWWEARVTSFETKTGQNLVNATAVLVYKSGHGYRTTSYPVRFLDTDLLVHTEDDDKHSATPWRARYPLKKNVPKKRTGIRKVRNDGFQRIRNDIDRLRRGIVRNAGQLEELRRTTDHHRNHSNAHEVEYTERRRMDVLGFVVHRMANEMRRSPRARVRPHASKDDSDIFERNGNGITRTCIRIFADCEQSVFEAIARHVRNAADTLHGEPGFYPSYELTQLPREDSSSFSIELQSFSDLCAVVGIRSVSDRLHMMCRYGLSKGEGVLRVLGAYKEGRKSDSGASEFFVGNSCAHRYKAHEECDSQDMRPIPVLSRKTSTWNVKDRRYEEPLQMLSYSTTRERQACLNVQPERGTAFEVRWSRGKEVTGRMWSREITKPRTNVGKMEVVLPCIVINGSVMCDEFTTCLTEDVLKTIVK